jgi:ribosomal protein S18 acetylase RimI-like enzyme
MDKTTSLDGFIRRVRPTDIPKLRRMLLEGNVFNKGDRKDILKSVKYYLHEPDGDELLTYVFESGGKVAGFASFGKDLGDKTYEIYAVSVSPRHQNKGIASTLIRFAESYLKKRDCRVIFIHTSSTKPYLPARMLYLKNGYKKIATVRDYFEDGDHMIVLQKRLRKKKTRKL